MKSSTRSSLKRSNLNLPLRKSHSFEQTRPHAKLRSGRLTQLASGLALAGALLPAGQAVASDAEAENLIRSKCLICHSEEQAEPATFSRMSHQRKTPEGWLMTIGRMQVMHGLQISDQDRRKLVKYFADNQGLAPEETEGARYAMERRLNTMENFESAQFTEMCARCHSGARVALQRRPAAEWENLIHFHLGQWPSLEYQALSRDRDWFKLALEEMVPELTADFPLQSASWEQWQKKAKQPLGGQWSFAAQMPAKGDAHGVMTVSQTGHDQYKVSISGQYADGSLLKGSGTAIVYTGYEWRANLTVDGVKMRQVFAASADGNQLTGRMFEAVHDEAGMDFIAARQSQQQTLLSVQPQFIKAGSTQMVTLVGTGLDQKGLDKKVSLGKGVEVVSVIAQDANRLVLRVKAQAKAAPGLRQVKAGKANGATLTVYDRIDSLKVIPEYSVARVGGNGGSTPKYNAHFQAEAWGNGADGKPGTADDLRIGFVPAKWHVEPFDEAAKADRDVEFTGSMNPNTGMFTTAAAGPNPKRRMSTNNAGNLKVVAKVTDEGQQVSGDGQLIVTVQRWNNPPLP
ncbi:quinohemoprotein amine dehydrogenase subunit alpha [Oceanospirillum beijerinckii]|uniref:quinohemoprotein amine dehydrogenase subunit alpha n=1 Tax=Oceanospirillum beijerinckii TaxID=64976 RepID=UPI00041C9C76|nr:quinohemoprotein amine dehydrogenase subunit alpha [Oceanospirillum beijerinckii]